MVRLCCFLESNGAAGAAPASSPEQPPRPLPSRPPRPASLDVPYTPTRVHMRRSRPSLRPADPDSITTIRPRRRTRAAQQSDKGKNKADDNEVQPEHQIPQKGYMGVRSSYSGQAAQNAASQSHIAIPLPDVVVADRRAMLRRLRHPPVFDQNPASDGPEEDDDDKNQHPAVREAQIARRIASKPSMRFMRA